MARLLNNSKDTLIQTYSVLKRRINELKLVKYPNDFQISDLANLEYQFRKTKAKMILKCIEVPDENTGTTSSERD